MGYEFEEESGRFVVKDAQGKEAGEITYSKAGDNESVLNIDHTETAESHRGQGLTAQLVSKVVEKAEREELKVMPLCPFAKKEFDENEAYREVLYQ